MSSLREELYDLKYLISKDNVSSRGFYLFITIASLILLIATVVLCVFSIAGALAGALRIIGIISPIIALVVLFGLIKFLSKSN